LSGRIDVAKPDKRIFKGLFNKYNVKPKHFMFVDDRLKNIKAAEETGFNSILFTNSVNLITELSCYNLPPK
jgi:2-haloacid dehalogenase